MLAADSITIRVMVKTAPLEQWAVARALRQRIKAASTTRASRSPSPSAWCGTARTAAGRRPCPEDRHHRRGMMGDVEQEQTFYDEIGGLETFRRIVAPSTRAWPPTGAAPDVAREEDLGPREERFLLPSAVLGRPDDVLPSTAGTRVRMDGHAPFAVDHDARDHWLRHFRAGLDSVRS